MHDMFKKALVSFATFISMTVCSQEKIATTFKYKATYSLAYSLDSTAVENKKSDEVVLFLGDAISSYSSKAKLAGNTVVTKGNTGNTSRNAITDFQYIIVKDIRQDFMVSTLQVAEDFFYYKQSIKLFDWKLHKDKKEIKGFSAQKATMSYSGRDYTAWFTNEIPISDGPYKFNGLPGLILEIADTENHYVFELKAFEKLEPTVPFKINLKQYIATTREKLREVSDSYKKDPFTYLNNPNITISPETHQKYVEMFKEQAARENNPIEKD